MAEKEPAKPDQEMVPDPDEDDLDDLDDVLDQFNANSKTATSADPAPTASGPGRPPLAPGAGPNAAPPGLEGDFAAQLQAGMANLLGELDENPQMQKEFEKMMQELVAAGEAGTDEEALKHIAKAAEATPHTPSAPATPMTENAPRGVGVGEKAASSSGSKKKGGEESFQDTIRRTMERMQASGDEATSAAAQAGAGNAEEDMLAQLMKELSSGGGAGMGGEGGEEDFNKLLLSMMTQLTNKEILYEPMKELHDKFPAWMAANESKVSKEDAARYNEQQKLVDEIVARFEKKGYSDENDDDREYIVERMQKMQAAGSPPPDLVGDMSAAQEALGGLEEGCPTQ